MFELLRRVSVLSLSLALAGLAPTTAPALAAALPSAAIPAPVTIVDPVVIPAAGGERTLLVRVTAPAEPRGKLPVILFSHGAALARGQYAPLIEWWARQGFVILQPDHEDAVVDGFPPATSPSALLWRTRIEDMTRLSHALGIVEAQVPALHGHLDGSRILAAGHSFGGHTVAALMGARVWNDQIKRYESFDDPLIKGAVLLSPPGSGGSDLSPAMLPKGGFLTVDWSSLRGPILVVVGSQDESKALTVRGPDWHADPYRRSKAADMCLLTLTGAHHYLGGIVDPRRTGVEDADPHRLAAVRTASLTSFQAALAGKPLTTGALQFPDTPNTIECR